MLQLVREYPFHVLRLVAGGGFAITDAAILVSAEGPMVEEQGPDAALTLLGEHIRPYIKKHWRMRWLISNDIEQRFARQCDIRTSFFAGGTAPLQLAEHLLEEVFEPMFRAHRLLIRSCQVWIDGAERATAEVPCAVAQTYETEMGLCDTVPPEAASLVPHVAEVRRTPIVYGRRVNF